MKLIVSFFLIAVITVIVIDMSGFIPTVKGWVSSFLTKQGRPTDAENIRLKPLDCSFCMTFWIGLAYMIATGAFSLWGLAVLCVAALATVIIDDVLTLVMDAAAALFRWIGSKLK